MGMKRLNSNNMNTPEMSDGIFKDRWHSGVHTVDWDRFAEMAKNFKGGRYLDLGCFNSPMPGHLAEEFPDAEIFAMDHAPETIAKMRELYPKVKYLTADFLTFPWLPEDMESFDYIVAGEVLEHLENPQEFVDGVFKLLKPGGTFAFTTPFEEEISQPKVSNEHLWAWTLDDLKTLLKDFEDYNIEVRKDSVKYFIGWAIKRV